MPNDKQLDTKDFILSSAELSLLMDRGLMPLKYSALEKIDKLLALTKIQIAVELEPISHLFPPGMDYRDGKVSRGENYKSYPYRVLDYPRAFHHDDIFTFRTMVLWGHHCSYHLILAGRYKEAFQERIIAHAAELPETLNLSAQPSPWEWEFNPDDFVQARALQEPSVAQATRENSFLKITFVTPLDRYIQIPATGREIWKLWQAILFGS